jgi:hypothetical protein
MALKLNNIKSLFIIEEGAEESKTSEKKTDKKQSDKKNTKEEKSSSSLSWKSSASKNADGTVSADSQGKYSEKIFDSLAKALFDANLPGEDYFEFIEGLKAMKDLPMDDVMKMKSVFMTLSTRGLTVAKIVDSAEHYLDVLNKEKEKFYKALESQKQSNVESKKQSISNLEAKNKEKAELIQKLTDEIAANNVEIKKISTDISNHEGKIQSTENDFVYTFEKMANQIYNNIEKIKKIES